MKYINNCKTVDKLKNVILIAIIFISFLLFHLMYEQLLLQMIKHQILKSDGQLMGRRLNLVVYQQIIILNKY